MVRYDGTNLSLSVDGVNDTSAPFSVALTAPDGITLGYDASIAAVGGAYEGGIDEFGIWNRALTNDEVASLYNEGIGSTIGTEYAATYVYLGLGTVVEVGYDEPGVEMTYILQGSEPVGDAGRQDTGLYRFGRVVDSRWINGSVTDINRVKYGYSEASNRLWRQNVVAESTESGQDEFYTYDGLYQLAQFATGR